MSEQNVAGSLVVISRRIEKSCSATLSLGDAQFLKISSLMSQDVQGTEEQLVQADQSLWHDVALDVRRGMWTALRDLGKTTEADKSLFEACMVRVEAARAKPKQKEGDQKA